ncbi:ATP synthase F1 subunit gamma [Candidatus Peregrinibacteria bacterium]|nr:ATP synthase F1 subunit gamma [Candidatus Peregrinibacteria bacterium]
MASLRDIKIRIKSVKSTQKITKAMEMVAASKMKRAQSQALKGRPYLKKLTEIIAHLLYLQNPQLKHKLMERRDKVKNVGYIFMTSNRGLCGSFNSSIIRKMLEILAEKNHTKEIVISVGRKGRQAMDRVGKNILADFETMSDKPSFVDTLGISKIIKDDFLSGKLDEVYVVYNHFYSTMTQKPEVVKLLPLEIDKDVLEGLHESDYIFEQDKEVILDQLMDRYLDTMVYQKVLESVASEHSARMMSMRQASDNAQEIVSHLTLHYNKARQAKITKEILEVVAGS